MGTDSNARVAVLRKTLGLSQEAFGERLGMKKNAISVIESGKVALTDTNARLICREFAVRPEWLHVGEGEMFESAGGAIEELALRYGLNDDDKKILEAYIALPERAKAGFREFLSGLAISVMKEN